MQVWYNDVLDRPPPPARLDLTTVMAEREELYRNFPLPGELIPVVYLPFSVDDGILEDEEITWEVLRICLKLSGSTSVM